ncbi:response regulator transcription factor [Phytoactinopolyspora endophytica]|uniref:response regulator transcription factor n=1 Tax=Phytoactinopolyspora endophytica TaxID=1642495 RepID=UPI00101D65B0|nr:response regulator transcription factor [Phytoactinopolyspora endophytica]
MPRVLLVEDDVSVRDALEMALRRHRHDVTTAATGEDGLKYLHAGGADIVVLDLMLPDIDGFEVCRRIRAHSAVPIVMLTARSNDIDVVSGLEAGADDYVIKPVIPRVLDARIRAVLRRTVQTDGHAENHGGLVIDRSAVSVTNDGEPVGLTPTELRLLLTLSGAPARVFSRQQLLQLVWEHDYLGDSRIVDACVQRVRAKIEDVPACPVYIQTVRGFGYRFGPL